VLGVGVNGYLRRGARSSVKYFTKLYCSFMKSPNERKHLRVGGSSSPTPPYL